MTVREEDCEEEGWNIDDDLGDGYAVAAGDHIERCLDLFTVDFW
jgi:hypothetical protein